jgi:hypothetical protein
MVTLVHNFDPKISLEGSAKLRWAGDPIFQSLCGPVERKKPMRRPKFEPGGKLFFLESPSRGRPEFRSFFWGGGVRSSPFCVSMSPKRQVRAARTRGKDPLVINNEDRIIYDKLLVCVCGRGNVEIQEENS